MKRFSAVLALVSLSSAFAEDSRIAYFDCKRVLAAYRHFLEWSGEIQAHIAETGPRTVDERFVRYKSLLDSLQRQDDAPKKGTPERAAYDLQKKIIEIEVRLMETEINLQKVEREKLRESDFRDKLQTIYREIWSGAESFAKEERYRFVIPLNLPDGQLASVIATEHGDDVTGRLIERINKEYSRLRLK